jgi:hypothetical protein
VLTDESDDTGPLFSLGQVFYLIVAVFFAVASALLYSPKVLIALGWVAIAGGIIGYELRREDEDYELHRDDEDD